MTHAKSLLFNVTLLVRPGLEPKIARFGGPHGASCGRAATKVSIEAKQEVLEISESSTFISYVLYFK
jgi:hypothetical protein